MDSTAAALVEGRRRLDAGEYEWLEALAEFDRGGWWAADGHLSCVSWLVHRCGMGRSTAKDKVRVAHELHRRPLLADALAAGEISYCKIRTITRITDADENTDRAMLVAARTHTVADLEQAVQHWRLLNQQDRPTRAMRRWDQRGLHRVGHNLDLSTIEITQPAEDIERLLAVVDTYLGRTHPAPVEKASREAAAAHQHGDAEIPVAVLAPTWAQRRADALTELLEAGVAHLAAGGEIDPEAAAVSVIVDYDTVVERAPGTAQANGVPISGEAARRLACDAGLCRIIARGASEVLDVGRRTRQWTTAQRRAIRYRHGGHCAFPGCERRITQIHHTNPWVHEGNTDLDAGVPLCWGHHHLVHEGHWTVAYNPHTGTTTFTSPDGRTIDAPQPLNTRRAA